MRLLFWVVAAFVMMTVGTEVSAAGPKTVRVRSYTRRDGTQVRAHMRSAPGSGSRSSYYRAPGYYSAQSYYPAYGGMVFVNPLCTMSRSEFLAQPIPTPPEPEPPKPAPKPPTAEELSNAYSALSQLVNGRPEIDRVYLSPRLVQRAATFMQEQIEDAGLWDVVVDVSVSPVNGLLTVKTGRQFEKLSPIDRAKAEAKIRAIWSASEFVRVQGLGGSSKFVGGG